MSKVKYTHKITEDELEALAVKKLPTADWGIREVWKDGYRQADEAQAKNIWKLQKVIKGFTRVVSDMYGKID